MPKTQAKNKMLTGTMSRSPAEVPALSEGKPSNPRDTNPWVHMAKATRTLTSVFQKPVVSAVGEYQRRAYCIINNLKPKG